VKAQGDRPDNVSDLEAYLEACTVGPGIFKWHGYVDIYVRHLKRFRGREIQLVEIGVAGGCSLGMWRSYLGPGVQVCGIDIDPESRGLASEGVEVLIGDQGDPAFWESFLKSYKHVVIVIDDGGHLPEQQALALETLLLSYSAR
jgi:predicted RNA methylase